MNIVFFTQEDPFFVKVFFEEFFKSYSPISEIKSIVLSAPMGKKSIWRLASQMYEFYGPWDFLRMGARYAYIKCMQYRRVKSITQKTPPKAYTIRQLADAYGVEVLERSDLNSKEFLNMIKRYDADLFISVASPIIFKEDLISIPKLACINIHNAPLPKYRGMLPNFWQLYHGETQAGITIHRIEKGIDTGDIVAQHAVPIGSGETLHALIIKTKQMGARFMIETIEDYRRGRVKYRKMLGEASYFTFPNRSDVRMLRKTGRRIM